MRLKTMGLRSLLAVMIVVGAVGLPHVGSTRAESSTPTAGISVPAATPVGGWRPWQTLALTDAGTKKPFTLADFSGCTVVVQAMATWCSSCRAQLKEIKAARTALHDDSVVFVAISIETDLPNSDLAGYAKAEGFDWLFAVATPEMLRALVDEFGRTLANPSATPHFAIYPDGSFSKLETGGMTSEELLSWIKKPAAK